MGIKKISYLCKCRPHSKSLCIVAMWVGSADIKKSVYPRLILDYREFSKIHIGVKDRATVGVHGYVYTCKHYGNLY